jgi:hypothetical protein
MIGVGQLSYYFGFEDDRTMLSSLISSGILLFIYIIFELISINLKGFLNYMTSPFKIGVLSINTFVYFLSLLILSSRFNKSKKLIFYNILLILSAGIAMLIGVLTQNLRIFRGIALTIFSFYLL